MPFFNSVILIVSGLSLVITPSLSISHPRPSIFSTFPVVIGCLFLSISFTVTVLSLVPSGTNRFIDAFSSFITGFVETTGSLIVFSI